MLYLERGNHLALFLTVYEVVVVLHRDERREAIADRVIWGGNEIQYVNKFIFFELRMSYRTHSASSGLDGGI